MTADELPEHGPSAGAASDDYGADCGVAVAESARDWSATASEIERLLGAAEQALSRASEPPPRPTAERFEFPTLHSDATHGSRKTNGEVTSTSSTVKVRVEIGRARVDGASLRALRSGSPLTLSEPLDSPVSVFAGNQLIARGELVVLDGHFCVRITERL
ncbi:MAG TPA: FliM/FliN family flagellar motor switch protein [Pirellulaceae bacterium]|nr:FliM/FliN family flagellar motor switch protein [Pirellulaceae bacterium]